MVQRWVIFAIVQLAVLFLLNVPTNKSFARQGHKQGARIFFGTM